MSVKNTQGMLFSGACLLLVLAMTMAARGQATRAAVPPAFVIGVDSQAVGEFAKWQARGINTVVRVPNGNDAAVWARAADAAGLWQIRRPIGEPLADASVHRVMAFAHEDEPDRTNVKPVDLAAAYGAWSKVRPVFVNFSGNNVINKDAGFYAPWKEIADWNGHDVYPVCGWNQPGWLDKENPDYAKKSIGAALDKIRAGTEKPQIAYIECADFAPGGFPPGHRSATPEEMRGEVWSAVIHGAVGIVYFPEVVNPWNWDGTTSRMQAEIRAVNAALGTYGPILLAGEMAADGLPAAGPSIEVCQRKYKDDRYGFALNASHRPCTWFKKEFPAFGVGVWKNGQLLAEYPKAGETEVTPPPAPVGDDLLRGAKVVLPNGKTYRLVPEP